MAGSEGWTVVVLASGRGTRMGGPKALMQVRGRAWWEVQEQRLGRAGVARIWVVSPEVRAAMAGCGSRMVDGDPGAPMFESVRAGVAAVAGGVFVLPVDVPAPMGGTFELLSAAAGERVAVPVFRGERGHPVALSREWIERVLVPAPGGDLRLDRLIAAEVREVVVEDPVVVVNLNTPEDVARWPG